MSSASDYRTDAFSADEWKKYDWFCNSQESYVVAQNTLKDRVTAHLELLDPGRRIRVLEIGFGTGECTRRLLSVIGGAELTAIDSDAAKVESAKSKLRRRSGDRQLTFVVGDAQTTIQAWIGEGQKWDLIVS